MTNKKREKISELCIVKINVIVKLIERRMVILRDLFSEKKIISRKQVSSILDDIDGFLVDIHDTKREVKKVLDENAKDS